MLPIHYGVNNLTVNNKKVLIIKGKLATGNAWEQDHYFVLEQQGDIWQIIRNEQKNDDIVARALPHTFEDSVSSVYFMVPKGALASNNIENLYLLQEFKESVPEMVPADFELSIMNKEDNGLGVLNFHTLQVGSSKAKYCNSDLAAYRELKIPLPDGVE